MDAMTARLHPDHHPSAENSSSDTYTESESEPATKAVAQLVGQTPTTSTTNLKLAMPQSPSKSILRNKDNASPRKNVAFDPQDTMIHRYPMEESDVSSEQPTTIYHPKNVNWSAPASPSTTSVPPPPPHRTDSRQFGVSASASARPQSMDEELMLREHHHRQSVEHNLHSLAHHMRRHSLTTPQSAVPTSEFSFRSSGSSSRSSLQSLHDDNRHLPSQSTSATSQGVVLKAGGLKGFSLEAVDHLIPTTHTANDLQPSPTLTKDVQFPTDNSLSHSGSDNDDDFDRSYLSTSQSIMNILNTAGSRNTLVEDVSDDNGDNHVVIKREYLSMDDLMVKQEPGTSAFAAPQLASVTTMTQVSETVKIKQEPEDVEIKDESEDSLFFNDAADPPQSPQQPEEPSMPPALQLLPHDTYPSLSPTTIDALNHSKVESVSDVGRPSQVPRLVETASRQVSHSSSLQEPEDHSNHHQDHDQDNHDQNPNGSRSLDSFSQSIRYELDSQWRLEHSHDGDREDNEEVTGYIDHPTLDPSATTTPKSSRFALDNDDDIVDDSNDADDALANSSNVAPPVELTYPDTPMAATTAAITAAATSATVASVTANTDPKTNVASDDEPTVSLDPVKTVLDPGAIDGFEASLSAEHDPHKTTKPTNFLSIWHQQQRRHPETSRSVRGVLDSAPPAAKPATLPQARPQKFKGVQVVSRRVVSPLINTSGDLLPELSDDSGLASHFGFLQQRQSSGESTRSFRQSSTPRLGSMTTTTTTPQPVLSSTPSYSLEPQRMTAPSSYTHSINDQPRRSRFRVPTLEIQRTNSILSPKNYYNKDIFEDRDHDIRSKPPTIKGYGLTTLPSMDQDDVKRILSAKQGMSQGEYAQIKLRGNSTQRAMVAAPTVDHGKLEKHASVCEASMVTEDDGDDGTHADDAPAHVAREVLKTPKALRSTDQFFHDYDLFQESDFPEPDPELCGDLKYQFMYADYPLEGSTTPANYEATPRTPKPMAAVPTKSLDPSSPVRAATTSPVRASVSPQRTATSPVRAPTSPVRAPASPAKVPKSPLKVVAKNGEPVRRKPLGPKNIDNVSRQVSESSQKADNPVEAQAQAEAEAEAEAKEEVEAVDADADADTEEPKQSELPDRGRLFFRVIGLKNVDLKDVRSRDAEFSITLDNGIHCIKTTPYKLTSAHTLIGKEFELTVHDSLQFILTLKMKYQRPQGKLVEVRQTKTVKPKSRLQRILGQKEQVVTTKFVPEEAEDSWQHKFAEDGSFARCYIDLEQYEDSIRGAAGNFNLNCFNEWETINDNGRMVKVKPYRIGELEVRMLFVPRTDKHEVLPSSMRQAYSSVAELQRELRNYNEGYMYQEGGDCDQMKRRFFKLEGTSLIAHSEFSHKTRAKINLSKVVSVKYTDRENIQHGSHRNFTDAMVMDNSFQIRFANGESIDFAAPSEMEKMKWIELIELIVSKNRFRRQPWVQLMLENCGDVVDETMIIGAKSKVHSAFPQRYEGKAVVA